MSFASNPIPTTITDVTVYLSGAQITRTATIKLPVGTTEFNFDKLSPHIQESSIQISGLKNASILSINFGINYFFSGIKPLQLQFHVGLLIIMNNFRKLLHANLTLNPE